MAGIGAYIAGGALQGLGAGMMQRQKVSDEERRDAALRAARQSEIETTYRMAGENQAASDKRDHDSKVTIQGNQQEFVAKQGSAAAAAAKDARESEQAAKERMLRLESSLRTNEEVRKIAAQAASDGKMVKDVLTDEETGQVSVVFADGTTKSAEGVIARKLPRASSSGSSLFSEEGTTASRKPPANRPSLDSFQK